MRKKNKIIYKINKYNSINIQREMLFIAIAILTKRSRKNYDL